MTSNIYTRCINYFQYEYSSRYILLNMELEELNAIQITETPKIIINLF